jgi:hypothetical protein
MSNVWSRFENIASPEEVLQAKTAFEPIEEGNYACKLFKLEPSEAKSGLPMLKGAFKTDTGKIIFYNQMLQNANMPKMTAVNIGEAVKFLEALTGEEIVFENLGQLANIAIKAGGVEEDEFNNVPAVEGELIGTGYIVEVSYGTKDVEKKYPKLKILEKLDDAPF